MMNVQTRPLVMLFALGLLAGPVAAQTKPGQTEVASAPIKAEPEEVEFKAAYAENRNETQVKLTNTSDKTVEILNAKGSCGCTTTGLNKKVLGPGESTSMTVAFRGARSQAGRTVEKKVTVTMKDPDGAKLIIPVKAHVTAAIMVEPAVLRLSDVEKGENLERSIHLQSTDGQSFAISGVTTAGDIESVTPNQTEPGMDQTLTVKIKVPEDPGVKRAGYGKIMIRTTHPKDRQVNIAMNWRLADPVELMPRYINLGNAPVDQVIHRTLTINPRKRDKFENLTFSVDNPKVTVTASPNPSRENTWDLAFTVSPDLANQPVYANLVIDTHVQPEGQVRVRVTGRALVKHELTAGEHAATDMTIEQAKAAAEAKKAIESKRSVGGTVKPVEQKPAETKKPEEKKSD